MTTTGRWTHTRRARWEDLPEIIALRFCRRDWLDGRGSAMLQDNATGLHQIIDYLADGTMRVVIDQDGWPLTRIVATYALTGRADPDYWHEPGDGDPDGALYLRKVLVAPEHRGLGEYIVTKAVAEARSRGKTWLRLNCHQGEDAARLHEHWKELGFKHVRTMDVPGRTTGALFQQAAQDRGEESR